MADKRVPVYEKGRITGYRTADHSGGDAPTDFRAGGLGAHAAKLKAKPETPPPAPKVPASDPTDPDREARYKAMREAEEAESKPKTKRKVNPYKPSEPFS